MMTLTEFADMLEVGLRTATPRLEIGLDNVGELAETLAGTYPGHYQAGWAPLAAATIADKEARGFPVPSPLKRTGEMAESYKRELLPADLAVVVGSPEEKALWQELGTSRMPARPVVALAMASALPHAHEVFGEIAVSILTGKALLR